MNDLMVELRIPLSSTGIVRLYVGQVREDIPIDDGHMLYEITEIINIIIVGPYLVAELKVRPIHIISSLSKG